MHDDLIKRLRECTAEQNGEKTLWHQAADAIEELAAFREQITDGHFYCMRDGVLYAAKYEMPKGKSIQLPPIKFAEPPKEG